jgi:carbamoyl-phosphate synthase small subunit
MKYEIPTEAFILLADGTVFKGHGAGKPGTATGEICFNTAMTGYQETFTDPSYFGQILVMTNAHIGNYGVNEKEIESDSIKISALVCKNFSAKASRLQSYGTIDQYFKDAGITVICDVDTRALVRHIRHKGSMNAVISTEISDIAKLKEILDAVPSMEGLELSSKVSVNESYFAGNPEAKHKVAVLDLGLKENIVRCLTERDCYVKVFPMNSTFEEMEAWKPDGYMITNGPGDPETLDGPIATVRNIVEADKKMFGICLGHQVLAHAVGLSTYKMVNGHRGINHPILNKITGKGEITSQNHGFVIDEKTMEKNDVAEITHVHLNDGSIAGIRIKGKPVFSVQYHPEAFAGPHDSRYLFDDFVATL